MEERQTGDACPRCGSTKTWRLNAKRVRKALTCNGCGRQVSALPEIRRRSKLPQGVWQLAKDLYDGSGGEVSAKELERALGVTYKTAWRMKQRLRQFK